jgi:hypothetical protein
MSGMLPRPEPRGAFKRALRAQLMAQAPGALARRETAWSRFQGSLLRPALIAAAIALLIVAGTGRAAAGSLPGDAAYPLKVAAEQLQLAFAPDEGSRLRLLAEQADHRLAELAKAVSARPNSAPAAEEAYAKAVKTLTVAVEAVRTQPNVSEDNKNAAEDVVDAAHQKHEAVLEDLKNTVSPSQQVEIERAKDESDKLLPSGRPARSAGPSNAPERTRTSQPTRTPPPPRTPEPAEPKHGDDQPGQPTRTPEPAGAPETPKERSFTPAPPVRQ